LETRAFQAQGQNWEFSQNGVCAMDRQMVNTYRYLRDNAKPCSQQDAADLAVIRTFDPPSKALRARIKRHEEGRVFVEPYVAPKPVSLETKIARQQLDFHKSVLAAMGGTRWIEPAPLPRKPQYMHVIPPVRDSEFPSSKPDRLESERRALKQRQIVTSAKMVFTEYQPDMLEIIDNFGNFPNFKEALK
jgi:hypothetical protein